MTSLGSKFFVKDLNVDRFGAILSAFDCWPEECEKSGKKCWTRVICESRDWFAERQWPQVATKMPIITGDRQSVRQINELMFALVLKELDLLTSSETLYYESVLDLFNDTITIGVLFWLKICHHFDWRLNYSKIIGEHQKAKKVVKTMLKEIDRYSTDNRFTSQEISYFYSVVDASCVFALAKIAIEEDNQKESFFSETRTICLDKLNQFNFQPFVRNLYEYNIIIGQTITFALRLSKEECIWDEDIYVQIKRLEQIFTAEENLSDNSIDDTLIKRDIGTARDNSDSLTMVNEYLNSTNGLYLILGSLDKYYNSFEKLINKKFGSQFDHLLDILEDQENPVYPQLVDALITIGDYETFEQILSKINFKDIGSKLIFKLAERLSKTKKESKSFEFSSNLLIQSLKSSKDINLEQRLKHFRITKKIMEANIDDIKTLFNQIIKEDKSQDLEQLVTEVKIGTFLDPIPVFTLLFDLALNHNKAQIGLIAKLLTQELSSLSSFRFSDSQSDTFLVRCFDNFLIDKPSLQTVEDMIKLIEEIIVSQSLLPDRKPILKLEDMFFYLIKSQCKNFQQVELTWVKLNLIKNIVELSGNELWQSLNDDPVPTIAFLLQFLDYFWQTPNRKQLAIELLNFVLEHKLTRNLAEDELMVMSELLRQSLKSSRVRKASTTQIYIAYCETRLPKPLSEIIDLTQNIYHDQILHYVTITSNFMWICQVYPEYNIFKDDITTAVSHILPALTVHEFNRLFKFLQLYFYNNSAIALLRKAIFNADKSVDKKNMIHWLFDIVNKEILIPLRQEVLDRPLTSEEYDYLKADLVIVFKAMALLDIHSLPTDMSVRLNEMLIELAQRMKVEAIPLNELYRDQSLMPRIARSILEDVMDANYFKSDDVQLMQTGHVPAGLQTSSSRSVLQAVYQ